VLPSRPCSSPEDTAANRACAIGGFSVSRGSYSTGAPTPLTATPENRRPRLVRPLCPGHRWAGNRRVQRPGKQFWTVFVGAGSRWHRHSIGAGLFVVRTEVSFKFVTTICSCHQCPSRSCSIARRVIAAASQGRVLGRSTKRREASAASHQFLNQSVHRLSSMLVRATAPAGGQKLGFAVFAEVRRIAGRVMAVCPKAGCRARSIRVSAASAIGRHNS